MGSFQKGSLIERIATQAAANSTLTLTDTSASYQRFTGTTTGQIVKLPSAATTLLVGQKYSVLNRSSTSISVQDGSSSLIATVFPGQDVDFRLVTAGSAAGVWDQSINTVYQNVGQIIQNWREDGSSPTPVLDSVNNLVYKFQPTGGNTDKVQNLYCAVKVPKSYSVGTQINMVVPFYSADTTGTGGLKTVTTLIRKTPGDIITSLTNQYTSTTSSQSLTVNGTLYNLTLDLTDASGNINSVAVTNDSLLLVNLSRALTDSSTLDLSVLVNSIEVIYTCTI